MPKSRTALACAAAALTLTLTACSGGSGNTSSGTAPSTPSPAPTSTTPTTPASTTPTAAPSPSLALPPRSAAQLSKALLALADLPSGFSIEKDDTGDNAAISVTSKDSRCARLVALTNADNPPGSKASAAQSYSGGEQGPFVDESLDAMGSAAAVRALQRSFQQAIVNCRTMTLKIPGQGSSPISVRQVSAPQAGTDPVAVRFTATSGPLEGFEVTMVTTGIDDVVLAVTVVAGVPDDIDGATTSAVTKAQATLGTRSGT
ncbi:hypothetical protein [Kribbella sp.]|uniref:hypothetical protein n=1 Tax=Kribbella sp. TaxID=1871183 RepID=UPI002D547F60|nr:hypothetical protein [Kribbella sp.]HZX04471.1 hypothetical protein [Kribbella sp.]